MADEDDGSLAVTYIGSFGGVNARFPDCSINFKWGQVRKIPPEQAHYFQNGMPDFIINKWSDYEIDAARGLNHVLFRRLGALGDIITVHGAVSALKKAHPDHFFTLQCFPEYAPLIQGHPTWLNIIGQGRTSPEPIKIGRVVNLNGRFEEDHQPSGPRDSRVDRTWKLFYKDSGLTPIPNLVPDFSVHLPEAERGAAYKLLSDRGFIAESRKGRPFVALASTSLTDARSPDPSVVEATVQRFLDLGFLVFSINGHEYGWQHNHYLTLKGCSVVTSLCVMEYCDVAITPDSGSMWMAHIIPTPLVSWFGPTPTDIKHLWHPLRAQGGTIGLQVNDWINCPTCWEYEDACQWTHRCLKKPDRDKFIQETVSAAQTLFERKRDGVFQGQGIQTTP